MCAKSGRCRPAPQGSGVRPRPTPSATNFASNERMMVADAGRRNAARRVCIGAGAEDWGIAHAAGNFRACRAPWTWRPRCGHARQRHRAYRVADRVRCAAEQQFVCDEIETVREREPRRPFAGQQAMRRVFHHLARDGHRMAHVPNRGDRAKPSRRSIGDDRVHLDIAVGVGVRPGPRHRIRDRLRARSRPARRHQAQTRYARESHCQYPTPARHLQRACSRSSSHCPAPP